MHERSNNASAIVRLDHVNVVVEGSALLSNCTLHISTAERVVILGANGAGKSTLLKVIHGLLQASSGTVIAPPLPSQLMIFQRPALLKRSVRANVEFELRARGFAHADTATRSAAAIAQCGLAALSDRYARVLSGGEQQRVALARAFAVRPTLLLADEPTASLAPAATRDVEALLLALHTAHRDSCILIMSTHNVAQAKRLATRIVFVDRGRIVEDASAADFFQQPRSIEAREYLQGEML
jgi:tungstate transport system ATP-binding protein